MPSAREIYAAHAGAYDDLVSHEDYEGHLLPALAKIAPLEMADVVELGAGTGRLTRLLVPHVRHVRAFDASAHMLSVAERTLAATGHANWELAVADNKRLPVDDAMADLAIAGWTFGHSLEWYPESWRDEIGAAVDEMVRVLRPGGRAVILETMTTGSETAGPPTAGLAAYYGWLEAERGFLGTTIRTDYRFGSVDDAVNVIGFFFGLELGEQVRRAGSAIVVEHTGIWWRSR